MDCVPSETRYGDRIWQDPDCFKDDAVKYFGASGDWGGLRLWLFVNDSKSNRMHVLFDVIDYLDSC